MTERLRGKDLAVLARETARTPMHNATLEIFEPGELGLRLRRLLAHIDDRIAFVPRYRQRVRRCPAGSPTRSGSTTRTSTSPTTYAARRCRVRASIDQLRELAARIMSRRLDRDRPLWEIYFVEGLEGGRVALLSKSHQILVDGISTVDLGQVLLDVDPGPRQLVHEDWAPSREQSPAGLVLGAVAEVLTEPSVAVDTARSTAAALRRTVGRRPRAGSVPSPARCPTGARPPSTPFNLEPVRAAPRGASSARRSRTTARSAGCTAAPSTTSSWPPSPGAIRAWLMTRAEAVDAGRRLRALVPMSVIDEERRAHVARVSSVVGHLRRPADRRGLAGRAPAPGAPTRSTRTARPAGRSPPTGSRASPASRRPRSTRSGTRVALEEAAATSTW